MPTNRTRVVLAGTSIVALVLVGAPGLASAQEEGEEPPHEATAEESEIDHCVREAVETGAKPGDCVESPNPILPATNELVWGALSFIILLVALVRFALPGIQKAMEERTNKIRQNLDEAERTRTEAQSILDEYQRQLADARNESSRIIEEARQTADQLRRDLMARAEADVAELRQRAREEIGAAQDRALSEVSARVAEIAIGAAERVVERSLDRDTNIALVESYINELAAQRAPA